MESIWTFLQAAVVGVVAIYLISKFQDWNKSDNEKIIEKSLEEAKKRKAADEVYLKTLSPKELEKELKSRASEKEKFERTLKAEVKATMTEAKYGKNMVNVICKFCGEKGGVHRKEKTKITKNRVNSVAGKAIGLGTNSESSITVLHCTNCDMDWEP